MSFYSSVTSTVAITQSPVNPLTGSFGTGKAVWFAASGTWTVPAGITAVRVRAWGAGADGGGGGGFAFKQTIGVTPGQSVTVTVGTPGGSATSVLGLTANNGTTLGAGGTATGGDINNSGGAYPGGGGGGAGNLLGAGNVTSGVGGYGLSPPTPGVTAAIVGGATYTGSTTILNGSESAPGQITSFDFVGTGPGGRNNANTGNGGHGANGGGGGGNNQSTSYGGNGGFPGGGGGAAFSAGVYHGKGANGLVILEY